MILKHILWEILSCALLSILIISIGHFLAHYINSGNNYHNVISQSETNQSTSNNIINPSNTQSETLNNETMIQESKDASNHRVLEQESSEVPEIDKKSGHDKNKDIVEDIEKMKDILERLD